jgi:hypothetical protein
LTGGSGADQLGGSNKADVLTGNADADTLTGGAGADTISGGLGNDSITAGAGLDSITTGGNADSIVFVTADVGLGTDQTFSHFTDKDTAMSEALAATNTITGAEVITDFSNTNASGAKITLGNAAAAIADIQGKVIDNAYTIVQGAYSSSTGVFTVGTSLTTGEDSLLLWDSDSAAALEIEAVVLVGVNSTETGYLVNAAGVLTM